MYPCVRESFKNCQREECAGSLELHRISSSCRLTNFAMGGRDASEFMKWQQEMKEVGRGDSSISLILESR